MRPPLLSHERRAASWFASVALVMSTACGETSNTTLNTPSKTSPKPSVKTNPGVAHKVALYLGDGGTLQPLEFDSEHPYMQLDQHPSLVAGILFGVDQSACKRDDLVSIEQAGLTLAKVKVEEDYRENMTRRYLPIIIQLNNLCEHISVTITRGQKVLSGVTLRMGCTE